jgi:hypothetical protein
MFRVLSLLDQSCAPGRGLLLRSGAAPAVWFPTRLSLHPGFPKVLLARVSSARRSPREQCVRAVSSLVFVLRAQFSSFAPAKVYLLVISSWIRAPGCTAIFDYSFRILACATGGLPLLVFSCTVGVCSSGSPS